MQPAPSVVATPDFPSPPNTPVSGSRMVYIGNVPRSATADDLLDMVTPFIACNDPSVTLQLSRCFAFVEFDSEREARSCVEYYKEHPASLFGSKLSFDLAKSTFSRSRDEKPSRVLLVHVVNLVYPVTLDTVHQIFSRFGIVERVVTFQKDPAVFQALVQMDTAEHAANAFAKLDMENIYTGCNSLRIQYSTFSEVAVRFNNSRTRDFTNPDLPNNEDQTYSIRRNNPRYPDILGIDRHDDSAASTVVIVYRLSDQLTPEQIFNLFSFYGHVVKVKKFHARPDTALVQFMEPIFAALALQFLEGVVVFGQAIHLDYAKMKEIIIQSAEETGNKHRVFSLKERRFGSHIPERVLKSACRPTNLLHVANVGEGTTQEDIIQFIREFGVVSGFKWVTADNTHTALLKMATTEDATHALLLGHNKMLKDRLLKLSFSRAGI